MTDSAPNDRPFVSVIVPVHNDAERLRHCLAALRDQTWPAERLEVLVVDNNSEPPLKGVVAGFPRARCLRETKAGSYAARNRALAEARGDLLAFTDADCLPRPDWIERGAAALQALPPERRLVGGRIELVPRRADRLTGPELYDLVFGLSQRIYVEREHFAATANVFVTAEIMRAVGPFDERLQSGGDNEWGKRAFAKGYPLSYADAVCVRHPTRDTWRELLTKVRRTTTGNCDLARTDRAFRRRAWIRLAKVLPSLRYSVLPALRAPGLSPRRKIRLLGVLTLVHYYEYALRLRRAGELLRPVEAAP